MQGGGGEVAFLLGLERNSDIVSFASCAPLFVNANDRRWNPDCICLISRAPTAPSYLDAAQCRRPPTAPSSCPTPSSARAPGRPRAYRGCQGGAGAPLDLHVGEGVASHWARRGPSPAGAPGPGCAPACHCGCLPPPEGAASRGCRDRGGGGEALLIRVRAWPWELEPFCRHRLGRVRRVLYSTVLYSAVECTTVQPSALQYRLCHKNKQRIKCVVRNCSIAV